MPACRPSTGLTGNSCDTLTRGSATADGQRRGGVPWKSPACRAEPQFSPASLLERGCGKPRKKIIRIRGRPIETQRARASAKVRFAVLLQLDRISIRSNHTLGATPALVAGHPRLASDGFARKRRMAGTSLDKAGHDFRCSDLIGIRSKCKSSQISKPSIRTGPEQCHSSIEQARHRFFGRRAGDGIADQRGDR